MSVTFAPQSLDFGAVAPGSAGPTYDPDSFPAAPPPFPPGTVLGTGCPAGNVTASIQGDTTHFKIVRVTVYKTFIFHGVHYNPVGSSDGVVKLPVSQGQAVSVQVEYDVQSAAGVGLSAALIIHGDTPAWGSDSRVPLTVSVNPVQTIRTAFGSPAVAISPGGHGEIPITVTNVTGPPTDITYSLPLGWAPSSSFQGVPVQSGLVMNEVTFHQVPAGGMQSGSLHFTLPLSTLPAGSYPFSIAALAFNGTTPVTPALTLTVTQGQISVALLNQNPIQLQEGRSATLQVIVTSAAMSPVDYVAINLVPANLPTGVTMSSVYDTLSDNPKGLPFLPQHNVDANGSRIFGMTLSVDQLASAGTFPITINSSASLRGADTSTPQTGSITTMVTVLPQALAFASGTLGPSTATASATWVLNAQGFWNFSGSIHESGVIGHAYGFGMALNVKDANGVGFAVVHSGSVGPNLPGGTNDDGWSDTGFDQRIIDLWPTIVSARSSAGLNVTTDAIHIFDAVLTALGVVVLAVLVAAGGGHVQCENSPTVERNERGDGVDVIWRCH